MDPRLKLVLVGDPGEVLMLLMRLKSPGIIPPFCEVITQFGDVVTCRVKREHLLDLYNSPDTFSVKAPRLIPDSSQKSEARFASSATDFFPSRRFPLPYTGKGIYFAAVDWGFDVAHANLRHPGGSTRFKCIWDQNGPYDGNPYGYGRIYQKQEIDGALQTGAPYQSLGYHPGSADILSTGMHGTHVLDIAAGTPVVGEGGVAPQTTLIGVQLGNNFVNGSDLALGDSVRLIEALHFIRQSTQDAPCVINMSLGSHGDSHTGRSLVEIAFDNFLSQSPGYALVQSVGNYYQANCHLHYTLKQGETYAIEWNIPHRLPSPNEVEIWYPGADRFSLRLIASDGEIVADVQPFEDIQISHGGRPVGFVFQRSNEPNTGLNHIDVILDVFLVKGKWTIELRGIEVTDGSFHAYCERNDASQARFSPHQSSPYTTTGSVCNSRQAITVGAYNHRDELKPVVRFSSSGPTVLGQPKPDLLAPGYKISAARSAPVTAPGPTDQLTIKSGSSMAAPHVSGSIALLYQKHLPERLSPAKTKSLLFNSLDPLPAHFSPSDVVRGGQGFLNVNKLINAQSFINMNASSYKRPVRRQQVVANVQDLPMEPERHAPYLHENCPECDGALLRILTEGGPENEPGAFGALNDFLSGVPDAEPFDVYRHFHPQYSFTHSPYQGFFVAVALPGKRLRAALRIGDVILLRYVLSNKTYRAVVINPESLMKEAIDGYSSTSQKPGIYVQAYGKLGDNGAEKAYVRIADANNRVLDNVVVLRKLFPNGDAMENISEISTGPGDANDLFRNREAPRREDERETGPDYVKARTKWFFSTRISPNITDHVPYYSIATAKVRQMRADENPLVAMESTDLVETSPGGPGTNNWTPLGASVIENGQATNSPPVSGRLTSIAVSANGNRIYVATANGGVWYSEDRGTNWESWLGYNTTSRADYSAGHEADSLSVGAIAVVFGTNKTGDEIYVGTGEPNGNIDAYFGVGIKHYKNQALKLEANAELAGKGIYKIVVDPSDSSRVFAATTVGLFRRKTDGHWEKLTGSAATPFANPGDQATDFIIAGTGASKKHYVTFQRGTVYEGNKDLTVWTALTGTTTGSRSALPLRRITLAAGNSNTPPVYALDETGTLYKLDATAFRALTGSVPAVILGGQGWYDLILGVDPSNDNVIYVAGDRSNASPFDLTLYRCTVAGYACPANTYVGTSVHADGHAIAFSSDAHGATQVWVGCDGGLFYSDRPSVNSSFRPKNVGIGSTQINYMAQRPDVDTVILAGSQDNGSLRYWGDQVWHEEPQGDGGGVAIDPNNPFRMMQQYVRASLQVSNRGGINGTWAPVRFPPVTSNSAAQTAAASLENSNVVTAFYGLIAVTPDGVSPTLAAFGTNRLWLTDNWGGTWNTLPTNTNPYTPATPLAAQDVVGMITAIEFASATMIFAATHRLATPPVPPNLFRYTKTTSRGRTTWSITPSLVGAGALPAASIVTAIEADDAAAGSFYVALGGEGRFERCYYYDGTTWHNAGPAVGTLNIPCHAVVVDPNAPHHVYLGSDVGVWKGVRSGNAWTLQWTLYSQGLPEAAITDLKIHQGARLLRAATHGRGIWELSMDAATGNSIDLHLRANAADSGRMQGGRRFPWVRTAEDPTRAPAAVRHPVDLTMSPDIKVRRASLPAIAANVNYYDFAATLGEQVRNPNWQRGDLAGTNQVFVQVRNRGLDIIRRTTGGVSRTANNVRVGLLMADASSGSSPDLPAGFTPHVASGDANPRWLAGSRWTFADAAQPFKMLSGDLNVRTPQVVRFDVRFSGLTGLTAASKVALLAFVTTIDATDKFTGTDVRIDDLIMADKHVAQRYVVFA